MKTEIHEAMQVSRNFQLSNEAAKRLSTALSEFRSVSSYFITPEQNIILRQADNVIDEIREKTGEYEAAKYMANKLTATEQKD